MATAQYSSLGTRSTNLAGTTFNGLVNTGESARISYDNTTSRSLYASVTIILGSITPSASPSIILRVTATDGAGTLGDGVNGDLYPLAIASGTGIKTTVVPFIRLYPTSCRFSIINNTGTTLAASGNEFYLSTFTEEVV